MDGIVVIRDERAADRDAIHKIHRSAFPSSVEANLVDLIRARGKIAMSLVAVVDDQPAGHVLFSAMSMAGAPVGWRALGLGPIAVLPSLQRSGIGSVLIREGLARCRAENYDAVFLIGDPKYYARFGFEPAHRYGLNNEYGVRDEFMVYELRADALQGVTGIVLYEPEFKEADG